MRNRSTSRRWTVAAAAAIAAAPAPFARADARTWTVAGSGTWSTAADWSPAGVPGAGDAVAIPPPVVGGRTVAYDYAGPAATLASLSLAATPNANDPPPSYPPATADTLTLSAGSLTATLAQVGFGTRGAIVQTGGAVTFGSGGSGTQALRLGYGDHLGQGVYQMSGGSLFVNGGEAVGYLNAGAFNQSAGTHTVAQTLTVYGGTSQFDGSLLQTGGLTRAATVELAATAYNTSLPAAVTVTGTAQLNVSGGLIVDRSNPAGATPPGTVTIAGSAAVTAGAIAAQPGSLNWTGGSIHLTGSGPVAVDAVATGFGSYLAQTVAIGPTQSLTVDGTVGEQVGVYGAGRVVQAGGTNTADSVTLGVNAAGGGTYDLSAGTLRATSAEVLGSTGSGTVNQSGGSNQTALLTVGGTTSGTAVAAYNLSGGTATVGATLTVNATGRFAQTGGVLTAASAVTVSPGGVFNQSAGTFNGPAQFQVQGRTTLGGVQHWAAVSTVSVSNGGALTVDADLGTTAAPTVALQASNGSVTFTSTEHLASLSLNTGVVVALTNPSAVLVAPSITFSYPGPGLYGGKVNLAAGYLDAPGASVRYLSLAAAEGFAGGTWSGYGGLLSSTAAADGRHLTGVGVIANGTLYTTFDGQPVTPTDVLARLTYYGDANLDGVVNATDYTRLDAGYVGGLTGWGNGDFNYDGVVDGSDYALMDNAYDQQAATATVAAQPAAAAVPEPGSVAAAGLLATWAARRRRR